MALLKIARMGHPVLRRRARPVEDPADPEIRRLAADMTATMADAGGVGLAAPQVHVGRRLLVYRLPPERETDAGGRTERPAGPFVLINPELEPTDDRMVLGLEGCLSIPEIRGVVPRYARVRYRGLDAEGRPATGEAQGFHARVLQHEVDHLDGILFLDRMTDLATLAFESELHHLLSQSDADADPDEGAAAEPAEGDA
jgi:peptide deformylase